MTITVAINPRMLTMARESRRLTQKALAEQSNTSQSSVSRAEAGIDRPSTAAVEAWADVLRYVPALFEQRQGTPLPRTPLFRKRAALKKADTDAIESTINLRCLQIEVMQRAVEDIPAEDVPKFNLDNERKATPEKAAQWVRSMWRVPMGPIADIAGLVEDHGVVVMRVAGAGDAFMGISTTDGLRPVVLVSSDVPGCRDRWTIAHELGHIVLHHHRDNDPLRQDDKEDEANRFASEFLMPADEIRYQLSPKIGIAELCQLKRHWRTSMQSLIERAHGLRRITDGQHGRLWRTMSAMGYRREEPVAIDHDEAQLIDEMVRVHLEDLGFGVDEMARALFMADEREFRHTFMHERRTPSPAPPTVATPAAESTRPRLRLV